ncbi:LytR/AlgR family response regulator transcription factor, partial [Niastella populi]|uniref:LytR/AlgR family response regulator transcription factor n=1 Tax=Niastella populi TaxID=550983 RepID=UPI00105603CA
AITLHSFRKNKPQGHIALQSQQFVQIVELKDINYFKAVNVYTTVFLNGGMKVVTSKPLKYYEELLSGKTFLRIHQSYMVNELYIHRYHMKEGILYLKDGTSLPVSLRKKKWLLSILKRVLCIGSSS